MLDAVGANGWLQFQAVEDDRDEILKGIVMVELTRRLTPLLNMPESQGDLLWSP